MAHMELAYVGLEVHDRSAMGALLRDVVGLESGDEHDSASTWRNDDRIHRIVLHDGPADDARYFGIEYDDASFDQAVERLSAVGVTVTEASTADAAARHVCRLASAPTPFGPRVELVTGLAKGPDAYSSPLVPGGFNTQGVGFGHLVFHMGQEERLEESHRFVTEGLGFAQSDWFEGSIGPRSVLARFYHCNARHHTLALAVVPFDVPQALNHVMLETVSADNVVSAFDRAWEAQVPIESGLGRHDNDRMFSFYVLTPAGFRLEFGFGAREIVEPWNENRRYDRPSIWGHAPVPATPPLVESSAK